jgi:hypothetical protein
MQRRTRHTSRWLLAGLIMGSVAGCSESQSPQLENAGAANPTADVASSSPDTANAADSGPAVPQASCTGSSLQSGFAAKDSDCAFLAKCPSLGKCYCGDKCAADKTPKCDPSLCPATQPKCFCGENCTAEGKTPLCPASVCNGYEGVACKEFDTCQYINKDPPAWCGCQKMDPIKKCWCGAKFCSEPREECPPEKCIGKPADKCILVPGEKPTGCWCDTCGLLGDTPKCFFILCPGA